MIIKNKELKNFLAQLNRDMNFMDSTSKNEFIIKIILLKWLMDQNYIRWNLLLTINLFKEFTFGNILYSWGNIRIDFQDENQGIHFANTWSKYSKFILEMDLFSNCNSGIIGVIYEYLHSMESKKKRGIYYTPTRVIKFMLKDALIEFKEDERIIDPACGCGFFLSAAYDLLMEQYLHSNKTPLEAHRLIVERQLFGTDIDRLAVHVAKLILLLKQPRLYELKMNIYCQDSLLDDNEEIEKDSFKLVVGNPPYIGHKKLDKAYKLYLKERYGQVYHDKGDISYCFFQRGYHLLKPGGQLIFIVSRYFLEALNATGLREFISINTTILGIVDFYGQRILKGAGVDPLIINLAKNTSKIMDSSFEVFRLKNINRKISEEKIFQMLLDKEDNSYIQHFIVSQNQLVNSGWRLLHPIARSIIGKIEKACTYRLEEICISKQGIITGRDKAFVFQDKEALILNVKENLLKPWIKGKNISPYTIKDSQKKLLYTNDISNIEKEEGVHQHLITYKGILEKRRECVKGLRKWYELQWGREKEFFESEKVIFPYKANLNKFALDVRGYYYSADVYGLRLKKDYQGIFSHASLIILLNSKVYDFYFKSFGKKLGDALYEYYPNTVMCLAIPNIQLKEKSYLDSLYSAIQDAIKKGNLKEVENIKDEANRWFMDYFAFSMEEMEFIISES